MSNLCGTRDNILSIVNYGLGKGSLTTEEDHVDVDESSTTTAVDVDIVKHQTASAASNEGSSATPPPPPPASSTENSSPDESRQGGNDNDENAGDGCSSSNQKDETSSPDKTEDSKEDDNDDDEKIAAVSDLSNVNRRIHVVTTAGLPWRTGTAVNALARALYLTRGRPKGYVTLMVPWLDKKEEQAKVYGKTSFDSMEEQEAFIREYSAERVGCKEEAANLQIRFYSALYHDMFGSIFATVDICSIIPEDEADIAIMEEPEHLTWFRCLPPAEVEEPKSTEAEKEKEMEDKALIGWTAKFNYVVGILHTNYSAYMKQYGLGASLVTASALHGLSTLVVKAYTHRLIRLSDTLPVLDKPKEVTCNVHGVRSEFFDPPQPSKPSADNDDDDDDEITEEFEPQPIYFIGKVIWAKGFDKLLEIEELYKKQVGDYFPIDIYGSGPDAGAIKRAFLGRNGLSSLSKKFSSGSLKDEGSRTPRERSKSPPSTVEDQTANMLFRRDGSLRVQIEEGQSIPEDSLVVEVQTCETPTNTSPGTPSSATSVPAQPAQNVMKHLGETTLSTGGHVTKAISTLSDKLTNLGLRVAFSEQESRDTDDDEEPSKFFFDPPRSRYELRRYSIPARFLGTKDHALLRDIPEHKIFINLSITEVLCTTTAEALAMGKFVILPNHREFCYRWRHLVSFDLIRFATF
ncbi:MAG: hypothetical protein SGILL_006356 [Bacillariaceae sp.]